MYNQTQLATNPNKSNGSLKQKAPMFGSIILLVEESKLQKRLFSGQITTEEYLKKKKMLKAI